MRATREAPAAGLRAPRVELRGVSHSFGRLRVLEAVDVAVEPGSSLALVGPSGCGKSTLLSLVAGLDEQTAGTIRVGERSDARGRLAGCALMPQQDLLMPWRSALDNACLALENQGLSRRAARELARPLFARFGLEGFEKAPTWELSGGMRQRVAFLRTLLAGKGVLLLDEPFGALDTLTRAQMQDWLREALAGEERTVVLVTHDVEEALLLCQTVGVLSARPGTVVARLEGGFPAEESRAAVVSSPGFVDLRTRALRALG